MIIRGRSSFARKRSVNGMMKRQLTMRFASESMGQRFAGPVVLIGSLFAIAFLLYVIDMTSAGQLVL